MCNEVNSARSVVLYSRLFCAHSGILCALEYSVRIQVFCAHSGILCASIYSTLSVVLWTCNVDGGCMPDPACQKYTGSRDPDSCFYPEREKQAPGKSGK